MWEVVVTNVKKERIDADRTKRKFMRKQPLEVVQVTPIPAEKPKTKKSIEIKAKRAGLFRIRQTDFQQRDGGKVSSLV